MASSLLIDMKKKPPLLFLLLSAGYVDADWFFPLFHAHPLAKGASGS